VLRRGAQVRGGILSIRLGRRSKALAKSTTERERERERERPAIRGATFRIAAPIRRVDRERRRAVIAHANPRVISRSSLTGAGPLHSESAKLESTRRRRFANELVVFSSVPSSHPAFATRAENHYAVIFACAMTNGREDNRSVQLKD